MPDSVPGLGFDANGVCDFCHEHESVSALGEQALLDSFNLDQFPERGYDCIVPLSGGRDSSFVLYLAKAVWKLNVLAVNYDNGFRTPQAIQNMETACGRLGVELQFVSSETHIASKVVRHNMLSSDLSKLFGVCRACTYGYTAAVYGMAAKHRVPLIFWGDSRQERTKDHLARAERSMQRKKPILSKFFKKDYYFYEYSFFQQRKELPVPGLSVMNKRPRLKVPGSREVHVFDYVPWERKTIKETIANELGWEKPPESVSSWRTDCHLVPFVNRCFGALYGSTKACFGFSNMIRDGQMTREEALSQEEQIQTLIRDDALLSQLLMQYVGLTECQAEDVLSQAPLPKR